jgi:alginate O-acetyltransferase complex protein AlgI
MMSYGVMLAICVIGCTEAPKRVVTAIRSRVPAVVDYGTIVVIAAIFVACTAYLVNAGYNPFLYFNF